jgi:signal transduction histidine kinase
MSATRSYVNGESHYSKGHNKAVNSLILYLFTEQELYWKQFEDGLDINFGAEKARIAMQSGAEKKIIKNGLTKGKNSVEDLDDMIWLFNTFKSVSFFTKAMYHWERGDQLNRELLQLGQSIHQQTNKNTLNTNYRSKMVLAINSLSSKIEINQDEFSQSFGNGTRTIKKYLLWFNVFFILILISTVTLYFYASAKRIQRSQLKISARTKQLLSTIKDLKKAKYHLSKEIIQHKKIIGTISHDIQSPLKYIQVIAKHLLDNPQQDPLSKKYIASIYKSTTQLNDFTKNLIDYSKIYIEERHGKKKTYSILELIANKILFFEEVATNNATIFTAEVSPDLLSNINSRVVSVIIHNLTDNAVKNTHNGTITIGAKIENQNLVYYVNDTGIGMKEEQINYYMTLQNNRDLEKLILSTYGIGLHLVLELLLIIKGKIHFESNVGQGTKVTVTIPLE